MSKKNLAGAIQGRGIPPGLRRGEDLQVGESTSDEERKEPGVQSDILASSREQEKASSQLSDDANVNTQIAKETSSQVRKKDNVQMNEQAQLEQREEASSQITPSAIGPVGTFSEEQLRQLAEMVASNMVTAQTTKKEKAKKVDLYVLLTQAIAKSEADDDLKQKFHHIAALQKQKINQGVFAPEALFTLYRNAALQFSLNGKKVSAGDLMSQALIAHIPQLMKDLVEQE